LMSSRWNRVEIRSDHLNHPIRVQSTRVVAEEDEITYSKLVERTGLSTGGIYCHLSILRDYIEEETIRPHRRGKESLWNDL
jgi:hypothetical protein